MIFTGIMGITASLRNNLFVSNLNSRKREKKKKKTPSFLLCITVLFTKLCYGLSIYFLIYLKFIYWFIDQISSKSGGAALIKSNGA